MSAQVRDEAIRHERRQLLRLPDDLKNVRPLEAPREIEKSVFVCRRMVPQVAAQRHDPALAFLRHNEAGPPIRAASRENSAEFAV
jgi:hypothetical protein